MARPNSAMKGLSIDRGWGSIRDERTQRSVGRVVEELNRLRGYADPNDAAVTWKDFQELEKKLAGVQTASKTRTSISVSSSATSSPNYLINSDRVIKVPQQYSSIHAAFAYLKPYRIASGVTVTIHLDTDDLGMNQPFIQTHPNGDRIRIIGNGKSQTTLRCVDCGGFFALDKCAIGKIDKLTIQADWSTYTLPPLPGDAGWEEMQSTYDWIYATHHGIGVSDGGFIRLGKDCKVSGFGFGILALSNGVVNASWAEVENAALYGVCAGHTGTIYFYYGKSHGNGGDGVHASSFAFAFANGVESWDNGGCGFLSSNGACVMAEFSSSHGNAGYGYFAGHDSYTGAYKAVRCDHNDAGGMYAVDTGYVRAHEAASVVTHNGPSPYPEDQVPPLENTYNFQPPLNTFGQGGALINDAEGEPSTFGWQPPYFDFFIQNDGDMNGIALNRLTGRHYSEGEIRIQVPYGNETDNAFQERIRLVAAIGSGGASEGGFRSAGINVADRVYIGPEVWIHWPSNTDVLYVDGVSVRNNASNIRYDLYVNGGQEAGFYERWGKSYIGPRLAIGTALQTDHDAADFDDAGTLRALFVKTQGGFFDYLVQYADAGYPTGIKGMAAGQITGQSYAQPDLRIGVPAVNTSSPGSSDFDWVLKARRRTLGAYRVSQVNIPFLFVGDLSSDVDLGSTYPPFPGVFKTGGNVIIDGDIGWTGKGVGPMQVWSVAMTPAEEQIYFYVSGGKLYAAYRPYGGTAKYVQIEN